MKCFTPKEYKIIALRDCPMPEEMQLCDTPDKAVAYWHAHIATEPRFDPERECFVVLLLNTRRRVKGHHFVSIGTMDTLLVDPRSVFRVAVLAAAHSVVLLHNHPSGSAEPSEADVRATRDLVRAGQLLRIEVTDHIIVGTGQYVSLRNLGFICS